MLGVLPEIVLDEAKTARGPLELVQSHHDALDVAALAEQLVQLFLRRVEAQVADVEGRTVAEQPLLLVSRALEVLVTV